MTPPSVPKYVVELTYEGSGSSHGAVTHCAFETLDEARAYRQQIECTYKIRIFSTKFKLLYFRASR